MLFTSLKEGSLCCSLVPGSRDEPDVAPAPADDAHTAGAHLDGGAVHRHMLPELAARAGCPARRGRPQAAVVGDGQLVGDGAGRAAVRTLDVSADGRVGRRRRQQTRHQQHGPHSGAHRSTDTGDDHGTTGDWRLSQRHTRVSGDAAQTAVARQTDRENVARARPAALFCAAPASAPIEMAVPGTGGGGVAPGKHSHGRSEPM